MHKGLIFGSIAALGLSGSVLAADGFSYSYAELGYVSSELDDIDVDGDGFALRGSYEFNERFHGFVEYSDLDYDFDVSGEMLELGAGLAWPLNPNLDFVGTVSYVKAEVDVPFFGSIDDDGFGLGAGLRSRVMEQLELTGGINYVSFDEGGDDTAFELGARYFLTEMFAIGAGVDFNDDGTAWTLGARLNFGQ